MDHYEYIKLPLSQFPQHTIEQYGLDQKANGGFIYLEIGKVIYGLSQAGKLANKCLREYLAPTRYYEVTYTSGLWRHVTRPIQFFIIVDNFGVNYMP